jgi:hypothetical protein
MMALKHAQGAAPETPSERWARLRRRIFNAASDVAVDFDDRELAMAALQVRDLRAGDGYELRALVVLVVYERLCAIGAKQATFFIEHRESALSAPGPSDPSDTFAGLTAAMGLCAKALRALDDERAGAGAEGAALSRRPQ